MKYIAVHKDNTYSKDCFEACVVGDSLEECMKHFQQEYDEPFNPSADLLFEANEIEVEIIVKKKIVKETTVKKVTNASRS